MDTLTCETYPVWKRDTLILEAVGTPEEQALFKKEVEKIEETLFALEDLPCWGSISLRCERGSSTVVFVEWKLRCDPDEVLSAKIKETRDRVRVRCDRLLARYPLCGFVLGGILDYV
ncbi:MAG: hypothetical protein ACREGH_03130 [Minisyncoccia bacterium]